MSTLRFIPREWIQTEDLPGEGRIVARDMTGRTTIVPIPGARLTVTAMAGILDLSGWRLERVEVASILSAEGGTLFLRRWMRTRRLNIHAALAVALAVHHNAPLWLEERLFTIENFSGLASGDMPQGTRLVH